MNFGCPQRIARRGYYGAFLMDNPELVYNIGKKSLEKTCFLTSFFSSNFARQFVSSYILQNASLD